MAYERELNPLIEWVRLFPGRTMANIEKEIKRLPKALRQDPRVPAGHSIKWKLRYLELRGDLRCDNQQWFVVEGQR